MSKTITVSDETYEKIKEQIVDKKTGTDIKHRITGRVLFHVDSSDLIGANLSGADLSRANLSRANLSGAKTLLCKVNFGSGEYEQAKQFIEGINK